MKRFVTSLLILVILLSLSLSSCYTTYVDENGNVSSKNYKANIYLAVDDYFKLTGGEVFEIYCQNTDFVLRRTLEESVSEALSSEGIKCIKFSDYSLGKMLSDLEYDDLLDIFMKECFNDGVDYCIYIAMKDYSTYTYGGGIAEATFEIEIINGNGVASIYLGLDSGNSVVKGSVYAYAKSNKYDSYIESQDIVCELAGVLISKELQKYYKDWNPLLSIDSSWTEDDVRKAIENGADVNERRSDGYTPLMYAALDSGNNYEVISALIAAGADVNAKDKEGRTALMNAAQWGNNIDVIKVLLAAGANVNARTKDGHTALKVAAFLNQNPDAIKALIEAGANVNAKDENGGTALQSAASFNNISVISLLLEAGADVNAKYEDGSTALMDAASYNTAEVVSALIRAGADVNAQVNAEGHWYDGYTALIWAAHSNDDPNVISVLLAAGADASMMDSEGKTALNHLAENDKLRNSHANQELSAAMK